MIGLFWYRVYTFLGHVPFRDQHRCAGSHTWTTHPQDFRSQKFFEFGTVNFRTPAFCAHTRVRGHGKRAVEYSTTSRCPTLHQSMFKAACCTAALAARVNLGPDDIGEGLAEKRPTHARFLLDLPLSRSIRDIKVGPGCGFSTECVQSAPQHRVSNDVCKTTSNQGQGILETIAMLQVLQMGGFGRKR